MQARQSRTGLLARIAQIVVPILLATLIVADVAQRIS